MPTQSIWNFFFDQHMTWENKIEFIKQPIVKILLIIKQLAGTKWARSRSVMLGFYNRFICFKIEYSVEVFGGCCKTSLAKLETIQKMTIKLAVALPNPTVLSGMPLIHNRRNLLIEKYSTKIQAVGYNHPVFELTFVSNPLEKRVPKLYLGSVLMI